MLSTEDALREKINRSDDPLLNAFSYARAGNYIDFGAVSDVDEETFLSLLERDELSDKDLQTFKAFADQCKTAKSMLLLADNCGEIVLDKLFLEQLKKRYPQLKLSVMVRGGEVLNDATVEDAEYAGLGSVDIKMLTPINVGVSIIFCLLFTNSKNDFSDNKQDDRECRENQYEGVDLCCPAHPKNDSISDCHDHERDP